MKFKEGCVTTETLIRKEMKVYGLPLGGGVFICRSRKIGKKYIGAWVYGNDEIIFHTKEESGLSLIEMKDVIKLMEKVDNYLQKFYPLPMAC
tara:strand:- start:375 stop:650 length:276 start_codon:yes stop_codon:yes gene_type:complete